MEKRKTYKPNAFGGIPAEFSSASKATFLILPVPYEYTTSYRKGTGLGPESVIEASNYVELFDEELLQETFIKGIHTLPEFRFNKPPEKFHEEFTRHCADLMQKHDGKILAIGGEHSITPAPVRALKARYKDLSVLQFDAHADLREQYEGSKFSHACAMKRSVEHCPVVQCGIRSLSEEEKDRVNSGRVTTFFAHEERDAKKLAQKVLKALTKDVYISFDVDAFDPAIIPGTGTPEPGGMSWYDALDVLRPVFERKNVVGVDVVETLPLKGTNITEFTIAKLIYRMLGYWRLNAG